MLTSLLPSRNGSSYRDSWGVFFVLGEFEKAEKVQCIAWQMHDNKYGSGWGYGRYKER